MLAPANPAPPGSGSGPNAPAGSFWYRVSTLAGQASPTLEWFVRAQHLPPGRAFRVELLVDDHATYAVGSGRTDAAGVLAVHGTLSRFEDQYCVGTPAVPTPITGSHVVAASVKADGSGKSGSSSGEDLMDPERPLACDGNGDGAYDYWLLGRDPIHLDDTRAAAR